MPPSTAPAVLMRPDADRIVALADRLRETGDDALARLARRAAEGLPRVKRFPSARGPRDARWA